MRPLLVVFDVVVGDALPAVVVVDGVDPLARPERPREIGIC
jgi:hypothetical protein